MPSQASSSTEELRNLLNINEGTIAAFEAVSKELMGCVWGWLCTLGLDWADVGRVGAWVGVPQAENPT